MYEESRIITQHTQHLVGEGAGIMLVAVIDGQHRGKVFLDRAFLDRGSHLWVIVGACSCVSAGVTACSCASAGV